MWEIIRSRYVLNALLTECSTSAPNGGILESFLEKMKFKIEPSRVVSQLNQGGKVIPEYYEI